MAIQYSVANLGEAINTEIAHWEQENKIKRLWQGDASLWTNQDESDWLGWLDVPAEQQEIPRIHALTKEIAQGNTSDIVLLGMGGSSLCPAMMAETFGDREGFPALHILDSTDPVQILHLEEKINLKSTIFIVASKSGSTLEPNIFKAYFYARLQKALNRPDVGDRFIAITDPHTSLEKIAKQEQFKEIFNGVPSIGGRYSALTNFGMVPSGLVGINVVEFLEHALKMRKQCLPDIALTENPGALLGIILGICAKHGKDKMTFIISPGIRSLGDWLEQLLAESTGKNGTGMIPVANEPLGAPSVYGQDRTFIYIRLNEAPDPDQDAAVTRLEKLGFAVVRLYLPDKMHLGAELFRWEIATAVAGSILGINPFNQPDVEESKKLTLKLANQYEKTGRLSAMEPFYSKDNVSLFTDEKNQKEISELLTGDPSLENYLQAHINRIKTGDYFDLSAFIEMSLAHIELLQRSRVAVRNQKKAATCLGFGPRFLHSTGQAYKGGPNTGVFLQITAHEVPDLKVPDHHYTFGVIIKAQAEADFMVLAKRSRRVLRIHFEKDLASGLKKLATCLKNLEQKVEKQND